MIIDILVHHHISITFQYVKSCLELRAEGLDLSQSNFSDMEFVSNIEKKNFYCSIASL